MKQRNSVITLLLVFALLLAACAGAQQPPSAAVEAGESAANTPAADATAAGDAEASDAEATPVETGIATSTGNSEAPVPTTFQEAPILAERVEAGDLPPVAHACRLAPPP